MAILRQAGALGFAAFRLVRGQAWSMSREPGFNLTDSETGAAIPLDGLSNCSLSSPDVTLTWLPSEPTEASAPGLHILHYDANDQYSTPRPLTLHTSASTVFQHAPRHASALEP